MQYTISQILEIAKAGFTEIFGEFSFLCIAEIVGCKYWKKAVFLECIEYDATGIVKAKCTICVFNKYILEDFFEKTGLTKETILWQRLLFTGHLSLYEDRINIIADSLSTSYTLWQLQQSQEKIIALLTQEWVLTNNKKTFLWVPPYTIAIVSSANSDWLEDFLTVLDQAAIPFVYTLYEATVHGNSAKESVYKALQEVYTTIKNWTHYSAICMIRGWGDTAGILWQNDIDIARWICHMPIPVIVAIWHTKDSTILDEVSFCVANTPTAAWQMFIDHRDESTLQIENVYRLINQWVSDKIWHYKYLIESLYDNVWRGIARVYSDVGKQVDYYWDMIQMYDPHHILKQWYAIVRQRESVVKNTIPLLWESIVIEMNDIVITATVESVATKE
jgi:exodeoxyribonuclease VII large subunit